MPASQHPSERGLTARGVVIRVAAVCSMIYGLLYVFTAFLLLSGALSQTDETTRNAAFYIIATSAVSAALMLLMAVFGFRAARDRFRIMPFCVVSVLYTALMIAGMVFGGLPPVTGAFDVIALAYNVLVAVAACIAIGLVGYNKRHPKDETAIPAPEYVPDSIKAAPSPVDAPEPAPAVADSAPQPAASDTDTPLQLRISSKIGSVIHDKMDVLDAHDNVIYRVHSAAVSVTDKTFIDDAAGNRVADIHAKFISLHNRYFVDMADGVSFQMESEWFHIKDVVNIDELDWQLSGNNMLEFQFDIRDHASGSVVAHASRQVVSLHDTYTVDVYDRAKTDEVVAVFVVMKHILEHRQESAAGSVPAPGSAQ